MPESTLKSLDADILHVIWQKQVWEKSKERAALTYAEIKAAVATEGGGRHLQKQAYIERVVRRLVERGLLQSTDAQPEQHENPKTGDARRGPLPRVFYVETRRVITWPTTARLAMIVFQEGVIPQQQLLEQVVAEDLVFHRTGKPFSRIEAEESLTYALGETEEGMTPYLQVAKSTPAKLVSVTKRTTHERPYLSKISAAEYIRSLPPTSSH